MPPTISSPRGQPAPQPQGGGRGGLETDAPDNLQPQGPTQPHNHRGGGGDSRTMPPTICSPRGPQPQEDSRTMPPTICSPRGPTSPTTTGGAGALEDDAPDNLQPQGPKQPHTHRGGGGDSRTMPPTICNPRGVDQPTNRPKPQGGRSRERGLENDAPDNLQPQGPNQPHNHRGGQGLSRTMPLTICSPRGPPNPTTTGEIHVFSALEL